MMTNADKIIEDVLRDAGDINVVVGPVRKAITGDQLYFIVATCDRRRQFRCDQVMANADARESFITRIAAREPRVIHVLDDELKMARLCEALWPGERISRLREAITTETADKSEP
jgi:hypothetical protein